MAGASITVANLTSFLKEANQNTYANKVAIRVPPTRLGSKDYHYEKGDLVYHDTYFGSKDFIGEEVVYANGYPVWGANYFGFIVKLEVSTEETYNFLREVLVQPYDNAIPVRRPKELIQGEWQYRVSYEGELSCFRGQEQIFYAGEVVYRGFVHGGFIS